LHFLAIVEFVSRMLIAGNLAAPAFAEKADEGGHGDFDS
jgi:hypothetical protein